MFPVAIIIIIIIIIIIQFIEPFTALERCCKEILAEYCFIRINCQVHHVTHCLVLFPPPKLPIFCQMGCYTVFKSLCEC